jgi:hypothetical protein
MLMMLTGTAWGQDKPACDSKGNIKTPELGGRPGVQDGPVSGEIDRAGRRWQGIRVPRFE